MKGALFITIIVKCLQIFCFKYLMSKYVYYRKTLRIGHWRMLLQPVPTWRSVQWSPEWLFLLLSAWIHWIKLWSEHQWLCQCSLYQWWFLHWPSKFVLLRLCFALHRAKLWEEIGSMLSKQVRVSIISHSSPVILILTPDFVKYFWRFFLLQLLKKKILA